MFVGVLEYGVSLQLGFIACSIIIGNRDMKMTGSCEYKSGSVGPKNCNCYVTCFLDFIMNYTMDRLSE